VAKADDSNIKFIASTQLASIVPTQFSANGGTIFSIVGSSFSLNIKYTVKFYRDDDYYVTVVASPVSVTVLSGYSPAWPFPAAQVRVSVEFQGAAISDFRPVIVFLPRISGLHTLPDVSGPFLPIKASGLSPITYSCNISDARTGLSILTKGSLAAASSEQPFILFPILMESGLFPVFDSLVVDPLSQSMLLKTDRAPFSPDFTLSHQDWAMKAFVFDFASSSVPLILNQVNPDNQKFAIPASSVSSYSDNRIFASSYDNALFLRFSVQLSSPESPNPLHALEGMPIECKFEREHNGIFYSSSYSVLLLPRSKVQCSDSFREQNGNNVTISVNPKCGVANCKFRIVSIVVENRRQPSSGYPPTSSFMVGSQNIGCNTATPIFFVSPFDSLANSAFREFIAVCVFNNTDTVQGGPVAFLAKANVSSVNWQYNATASISYRVL